MIDFIFKEWQKKLSDFESSVKKDLAEIRKCKAEIQQMKQDTEFEKRRGRYIHDDERLILSAPEIIIGNVDDSGVHFNSAGSKVTIRSSQVDVHGIGKGGQVEMRSPSIRQIAEDPGCDGLEHVVGTRSEVVSQARHIVLHSQAEEGVFSEDPTYPRGATGVRIHADEKIEIDASVSETNQRERLVYLFEKLKKDQIEFEQKSARHKTSLGLMVALMEKLLDDKKKMGEKDNAVRACYEDIEQLNGQIEELSLSLSEEVYSYADVLSLLSETNRALKCVEAQQKKIKDAEKFKKETTGASVAVTGELISLESRDGDRIIRENPEAGINVVGRTVKVMSDRDDNSLIDDGQLTLSAMNILVDTANTKDVKFDKDGKLESAQYPVEGHFCVRSKTVTISGADEEAVKGHNKQKEMASESKITLQAQNVEVSTSHVKNVDIDDNGEITKAEYPADGEVLISSKNIKLESIDSEFDPNEQHKRKEKALTANSLIQMRSEHIDMGATTTEGKATGNIRLNAKDLEMWSIDLDQNDPALTKDSVMAVMSERIYLGAPTNDKLMSHKVQAWAEKITLLGSKVLQAIQGEKKGDNKAFLLLKNNEAKLKGTKTELHGNTEIVGDTTLHQTTVGDIEIKGEIKSNYLGGGVTAGPSPKSTLKEDDDYQTEQEKFEQYSD